MSRLGSHAVWATVTKFSTGYNTDHLAVVKATMGMITVILSSQHAVKKDYKTVSDKTHISHKYTSSNNRFIKFILAY